MKAIYVISLTVGSLTALSQQQGNLFAQNNINAPAQYIQTNALTNVGNLNVGHNNNDTNSIAQQQINTIGNDIEQQQSSNSNKQMNDDVNSNGKDFDMSFNFSSRSFNSSSNKKTHNHTFYKRLTKFNRNLYGKMTLHKKSKHLVDVCFNWSK